MGLAGEQPFAQDGRIGRDVHLDDVRGRKRLEPVREPKVALDDHRDACGQELAHDQELQAERRRTESLRAAAVARELERIPERLLQRVLRDQRQPEPRLQFAGDRRLPGARRAGDNDQTGDRGSRFEAQETILTNRKDSEVCSVTDVTTPPAASHSRAR